jgi:hypothetical protein
VVYPCAGESAEIAGTASYVNASVEVDVALVPPGVVTVTMIAPVPCAGDLQVIVVALTTTILPQATDPNLTVAPETKPLPVIVTGVPPATGPTAGLTRATVGTGQ